MNRIRLKPSASYSIKPVDFAVIGRTFRVSRKLHSFVTPLPLQRLGIIIGFMALLTFGGNFLSWFLESTLSEMKETINLIHFWPV